MRSLLNHITCTILYSLISNRTRNWKSKLRKPEREREYRSEGEGCGGAAALES
jgi:hypothetical protein